MLSQKIMSEWTQDLLNLKDLDKFYRTVGIEAFNVGIFSEKINDIESGVENTLKTVDRLTPKFKKSSKILLLGSAYGYSARYFVRKYGCKVDCSNASARQNEVHARINKDHEDLHEKITIVQSKLEKIPFNRESYDLVFCQDQLYLSTKREKVFREVHRVLEPEGRFVFTDLMRNSEKPMKVLENHDGFLPVDDLFSVDKYRRLANRIDFEPVYIKTFPNCLQIHFRLLLELWKQDMEIEEKYKTRIDIWLNEWVHLANEELIEWGLLQFQKRNV